MPLQPPPPNRYNNQADHSERGFQRLQFRHDTEENWIKNDPILARGEMGYTIAGSVGACLKIGDGIVPWSQLPYLAGKGDSGPAGPPGMDGHGITVYGPQDRPPVHNIDSGDIWLCSLPGYPGQPAFDAKVVTPGAQGLKGDTGDAATITIGRVVSVGPLVAPQVQNSGTTQAAILDFALQQGPKGDPGLQGLQGPVGLRGPAGDTFKVSGAVEDAAHLPQHPPALSVYITKNDAHLHIYDTSSAAADPNNGYVDLGAIEGKQGEPFSLGAPVPDAASLPAAGAVGQCVMTTDDGHLWGWDGTRWVDGGPWRGPPGTGIADGTKDGQVPFWDSLKTQWIGKDAPKGLPDGLKDEDILQWNEPTKEWVAKVANAGMFVGALQNVPPVGRHRSGQVFYLTGKSHVSDAKDRYPTYPKSAIRTWGYSFPYVPGIELPFIRMEVPDPHSVSSMDSVDFGSGPVALTSDNFILDWDGVDWWVPDVNAFQVAMYDPGTAIPSYWESQNLIKPKPYGHPWDDKFLVPLGKGQLPDTEKPGEPVKDKSGNPVALPNGWTFNIEGKAYGIGSVTGLLHRINDRNEVDPKQWALGSSPPVELMTPPSVRQVDKGFFFHDGGKWVPIDTGSSTLPTLAALSDTTISSPASGDSLLYNGSKWVNKHLGVYDLKDVAYTNAPGNPPLDGACLVFDRTDLKWHDEMPPATADAWHSGVTFVLHELCYHEGYLYRSLSGGNIGKVPDKEPGFWHQVSGQMFPRWHTGFKCPKGTIALVPWEPTYFHNWDLKVFEKGRVQNQFTLWVADADIPGDRPIAAGEPVSVSDVPPGVWHPTLKTPPASGGYTGSDAWSPLMLPGARFFASLDEMVSMSEPVIPGTRAMISHGEDFGKMFTYTGIPSTGHPDSKNAEYWGWSNAGVSGIADAVAKLVQPVVTGIEHGAAVRGIQASPPASPLDGDLFIVGVGASGLWIGHDNQLAFYKGAIKGWEFSSPYANEAHLNEADNAIYHWNGSAWNKISNGSGLKFLRISKADYDALGTKDSSTLYLVTS